MKKKSKRTLTPKLRFPEFRKEPGWEICSLIDLADPSVRWSFIGGPFGSNLKASDYTQKGVRIIQLQNIGDGEFLDAYKIYTSQAKADELLSCNAYPGEIILSKMGDPVGRACLTPTSEPRYLMCSDGIRLVVDENRFDKMFVFLAINFGAFRQRVEAAATGSTRKRIGLDILRQLPIEIPKRAEQQKIAECLSSLDGLIAADGRTLEALKGHKKGLMQQLFPQPGETKPRLRFPEFRDKGGWKTIILGEVVSISKGKGVAKSDVVAGGTTPCIRYAELYTIYGEVITHVHSRTNLPVGTLLLSQEGDVIIPASGETKEDIATCACVMSAGVALGSDLNVLRSDIDGQFFSYYLNGVQRRELAKVAQGDSVAHLYPAQISRLSISIAQEPDEQQRIAACLTGLDTQIAAQAEKIESLKQHKRGLMHQLFPAPEEQ